MTKATFTAALLIAGASISILSACGDGPTGPESSLVSNPLLSNLQLLGPSTIEPGATATFTMMSTWTDGSVRNVTSQTTWISSDPAVVSISASGAATAHARGETTIRGVVTGPSSARSVMVLPTGTFKLSGSVIEGPNISVPGARVEVSPGVDTLTTTTGMDGAFVLYGVPRSAELRVSKAGYVTHTQPIQIDTDARVNVSLKPNGPVPDISGTYKLTINAEGCVTAPLMPDELRRRAYTATVTLKPDQIVTVALSGADFSASPSQSFTGSAGAAGVYFRLGEGDSYYRTHPDVVEKLPDGTFLTISGLAFAAQSGSGLRGTLNGSINHLTGSPMGGLLSRCESAAHGFVMAR